jgi:hypothetical protein
VQARRLAGGLYEPHSEIISRIKSYSYLVLPAVTCTPAVEKPAPVEAAGRQAGRQAGRPMSMSLSQEACC